MYSGKKLIKIISTLFNYHQKQKAIIQVNVIPEHLAVKNNPPNIALYCKGDNYLIKTAAKVCCHEQITPSKNLPTIRT